MRFSVSVAIVGAVLSSVATAQEDTCLTGDGAGLLDKAYAACDYDPIALTHAASSAVCSAECKKAIEVAAPVCTADLDSAQIFSAYVTSNAEAQLASCVGIDVPTAPTCNEDMVPSYIAKYMSAYQVCLADSTATQECTEACVAEIAAFTSLYLDPNFAACALFNSAALEQENVDMEKMSEMMEVCQGGPSAPTEPCDTSVLPPVVELYEGIYKSCYSSGAPVCTPECEVAQGCLFYNLKLDTINGMANCELEFMAAMEANPNVDMQVIEASSSLSFECGGNVNEQQCSTASVPELEGGPACHNYDAASCVADGEKESIKCQVKEGGCHYYSDDMYEKCGANEDAAACDAESACFYNHFEEKCSINHATRSSCRTLDREKCGTTTDCTFSEKYCKSADDEDSLPECKKPAVATMVYDSMMNLWDACGYNTATQTCTDKCQERVIKYVAIFAELGVMELDEKELPEEPDQETMICLEHGNVKFVKESGLEDLEDPIDPFELCDITKALVMATDVTDIVKNAESSTPDKPNGDNPDLAKDDYVPSDDIVDSATTHAPSVALAVLFVAALFQ